MKIFAVTFLLVGSMVCRGADIYLTNLVNATVKSAIESAGANDTVWLPAGTATWSTAMNITGRRTLRGAGINQTIITMSGSPTITTSGSGIARLCHMTIVSGGDPMIKPIGFTNWGFRVDHCLFTNLSGNAAIQQEGWNYGVVDSSFFRTASGSPPAANAVLIYGDGNGNVSTNSAGQTNNCPSYDTIPLSPGSTNMLYIEDNGISFNTVSGGNGAVDAYRGARYCFRFNNVTNTHAGNHGTDSVGSLRGCVWWEVYGNNFRHTSAQESFSFRGGTGVIVSNATVQTSGTLQNHSTMNHYRATGTNVYPAASDYQPYLGAGISPPPCCSPYGATTLTNSVLDNYWGGTNRNQYGYPTYDQMGWGPPSRYMANGVAQTHAPFYQWSNTFNGAIGMEWSFQNNLVNNAPYDFVARPQNIIVEDRDYYNNVPHPTWVPIQRFHPIRIAQNSAPTLNGTFSDQTVGFTQAFSPISVIVTDDDDLPICTFNVTSSNPSFVPTSGIVLSDQGTLTTNRTISIASAVGAHGTSDITVSFMDPYGLYQEQSFSLTRLSPGRLYYNVHRVGVIRTDE